MQIRPARPDDVPAIADLLSAAFGGGEEVALVTALRREGAVLCDLVADDGDAVIGHAMMSWLVAPAGWAALAPVAVRPARQRRGVGTALVKACLAAAEAAGARAAVVLGEPGYYGRFGFSVAAARDLTSPYPLAFTGLWLPKGAALSPEDSRARLVYPPAFGAA